MDRLAFRRFRKKYLISILFPIFTFGFIGFDVRASRNYKKLLAAEEAKRVAAKKEIIGGKN